MPLWCLGAQRKGMVINMAAFGYNRIGNHRMEKTMRSLFFWITRSCLLKECHITWLSQLPIFIRTKLGHLEVFRNNMILKRDLFSGRQNLRLRLFSAETLIASFREIHDNRIGDFREPAKSLIYKGLNNICSLWMLEVDLGYGKILECVELER